MLRPLSQVAAVVARAAGLAPRLGPRLATFGWPAHLSAAEGHPAIRIEAIHTALSQGQRLVPRTAASLQDPVPAGAVSRSGSILVVDSTASLLHAPPIPISPAANPLHQAVQAEAKLMEERLARAKAEAKIKEAEARIKEAEAKVQEAEAAEAPAKAKAEAKAKEAEARIKKAEAKAKEAEAKANAAAAFIKRLLLALAVWLGLDCIYHEASWFMWLRMALMCKFPTTLPTKAGLMDVPSPVVPHGTPLLLLGPTGCGKSTLLQQLYNSHDGPRVFISLRSSTKIKQAAPTVEDMEFVAEQVLAQIHYPTRRWIMFDLADKLGHRFTVTAQGQTLRITSPLIRVRDAVTMLFSVLFWLAWLTGTSPLLVMDDLEDLVRTDRLRSVGGRDLFEALATSVVKFTNDFHAVAVAVAGSSSSLLRALRSMTVASPDRWTVHTMSDLPRDEVYNTLTKKFGEDIAKAALEVCGLRARPLSKVLQAKDTAAAKALLAVEMSTAHGAIQYLLAAAGRDERAMRFLLRRLHKGQAGWLQAASAKQTQPVLNIRDPALRAIGIKLTDLPESMRKAEDLGQVLFLLDEEHLVFQSNAVFKAWGEKEA